MLSIFRDIVENYLEVFMKDLIVFMINNLIIWKEFWKDTKKKDLN